VSNLSNHLLELLLQVLDLVLLIAVFNTLVSNLLLGHNDFLVYRLLVLLPLTLELFKFFIDGADLSLKNTHVLCTQLADLV